MAPPNNRTASCPSNSRGNIYVCVYIYIYIYIVYGSCMHGGHPWWLSVHHILAGEAPWTEEPGRLQSMGWQKSDTAK